MAVFPARAGMILGGQDACGDLLGIPRESGDDPAINDMLDAIG